MRRTKTDCSKDRQFRDRVLIKRPMRLQEYVTCAERFVLQDAEPDSYDEALQSKKSANWTDAMQSEMSSLNENETLVAATSDKEAKQFIDELKSEFNITAKEASYFLEFEIDQRQDGSIKISQASYSRKLLEQFGMSECRSSSTPAISESVKEKSMKPDVENKIDKDEPFSYRSAAGLFVCLMLNGTSAPVGPLVPR